MNKKNERNERNINKKMLRVFVFHFEEEKEETDALPMHAGRFLLFFSSFSNDL